MLGDFKKLLSLKWQCFESDEEVGDENGGYKDVKAALRVACGSGARGNEHGTVLQVLLLPFFNEKAVDAPTHKSTPNATHSEVAYVVYA